ncbi:metal-dependent hydrolase [Geomonas subterranea]|uniref:metal-dependent hydrolase n=1 Tax=Geomonas subterranea TaxID=2847989 RepID=UPI001CD38284|nr:metal-dependent hydrolase [Geomonas fuzhouensis]
MFIGHFAVGLGAKAAAPKTSLGTLFLASQFVDLLWPTLLLLGFERVHIAPGITSVTPLDFEWYPISHSLLAVTGWAVLVALVYQAARKYPPGAIVLGLAVLSHWFLDLVVHRPDLPLVPGGSMKVGMNLWNSLAGTFIVEMGLFAVGLVLYLRKTNARDAVGRWGLWALIVLLMGIYLGNLFGPPPPSVAAIAWVGQSQWLLVLWGYWVDRHRTAIEPALRSAYT